MEKMFVRLVSIILALAIVLVVYFVVHRVLRTIQKKIKRAFDSGLYLGYTDAMEDVENAKDLTTDELVERYVKKHGLEEMYESV